jgi:predicted CoA-binding protein
MKLHLPPDIVISIDPIGDILRETKAIAVVGLSSNPARPSFSVAQYLQSAGYRIIPVNPNEREVLGEKAYARLEEVPETIDLVDVFRRSENVPPVADAAIAIRANVLWLQLGIENAAASAAAHAAGLSVVEDACLLVEHKKRRHR